MSPRPPVSLVGQAARSKAIAAICAVALGAACAARAPVRPSGTASADPTAAQSFATATSSCRGFRSLTAELSLSGRAGDERVRGRVITGLESGGSVRLEGVAPFGAPVFILAGRGEKATLLLPRERRVLRETAVAAVLERLTGLALGADDLRWLLSGCLVEAPAPAEGRQWPGGWQAVTLAADRVAYIRVQQQQPVIVAADYGEWRVDYSGHVSGFPRVVRVRRTGGAAIDITARIGELEVNTTIDARAFTVDVPSEYDPLTLDELRSVAPLKPSA